MKYNNKPLMLYIGCYHHVFNFSLEFLYKEFLYRKYFVTTFVTKIIIFSRFRCQTFSKINDKLCQKLSLSRTKNMTTNKRRHWRWCVNSKPAQAKPIWMIGSLLRFFLTAYQNLGFWRCTLVLFWKNPQNRRCERILAKLTERSENKF